MCLSFFYLEGVNKDTTGTQPGRIILLLLAVLFVARLCTVMWSLDKGIDITDESCYLLSYHYPDVDNYQQTDYHHVVNMWFGWTGLGLVTIRLLRFLLEMVALVALIWGVHGFVSKSMGDPAGPRPSLVLMLLFSASGLFLSLFSRGLYYDHLSLFCAFVATGFLLQSLSGTKGGMVFAALAGFACGWLWMIKFPTAILLTLMSMVLLVCLYRKSKILPGLAAASLFILTSALPFVIFLAWMGQSPGDYLKEFSKGQEVYQLLGYHPGKLITEVYLPDVGEALLTILPALLSFLFWIRVRKQKYGEALLLAVLIGIASLIVCNHPGYHFLTWKDLPSALIQSSHLYTLAALSLLMVLLKERKTLFPEKGSLRRFLALILLLWSLPYLLMAGTDTVFSVSQYTYLAAWFPVLLLMGFKVSQVIGKRSHALMQVSAVLLASLHFFGFYLFTPYRMHDSLFAQDVKVEGPHETFYMDAESAEMVKQTRAVLDQQGFRKGYPLLAVDDLPGLIYLTDGSPAGTYWFFSGEPSDAYNCRYISTVVSKSGMPIVLVSENVTAGTRTCINDLLQENKASQVGAIRDVYKQRDVLIYDN